MHVSVDFISSELLLQIRVLPGLGVVFGLEVIVVFRSDFILQSRLVKSDLRLLGSDLVLKPVVGRIALLRCAAGENVDDAEPVGPGERIDSFVDIFVDFVIVRWPGWVSADGAGTASAAGCRSCRADSRA